MVAVPLGVGAYKRTFGGEPEVQLINRFLEKNPTNLREHIALLTRAGTNELVVVPSGGSGAGPRGHYFKDGLFNGDLFVVSGQNLYRYNAAGTLIHITGTINGTGFPEVTWQKGIGYQRLFIADGLLLQYYEGGTHGTSALTYAPGTITSQVIQIGGVYYSWNASVDTNSPDGTASHPFLAAPGSDPILAMANLLNFNGTPGVDFSSTLGGPNTEVSATTTGTPATVLTVTSRSDESDGNSISTTVVSGSFLTWNHSSTTGANVHALHGTEVPPIALSDNSGATNNSAKALSNVSGYVLVSVGNTQAFYWINPGEVTIDPLNFAEKESNPDNINAMLTAGDQVVIMGQGSTENWYATGDINAPFAPQEGRVYQRGVIDGTSVLVKDSVMIVGNDGVVYEIGYAFGTTAQWGVRRISDHGIEERIRVQLRREQGLVP